MAPVSTGAIEIPLEIIERFRARALERIERLEAHWHRLTSRETADPDAVEETRREIHTLKGDSRVVGLVDVHLLAHTLEELMAVAHRLDYRVTHELDLAVTTGFGLLAVLVGDKAGAGGTDLTGFLVGVDRVLRDASRTAPRLERQVDRVAVDRRLAIAAAATDVFLEHLSATGGSRERLVGAWRALRGQLAELAAVGLQNLVAPHVRTVAELAAELGKSVDVRLDLPDRRVGAEAGAALDTALRHLLRNAVSHGLETPEARRLAGKPAAGRIAVRVRLRADGIEIEVEDDGAGVDVAALRRRGVERGLLAERWAASASEEELAELVFQPGFSAGVGLDEVRATLQREGGSIGVLSRQGTGTTFVLHIPQTSLVQPVHAFPAAGMSLQLAIAARPGWSLELAAGGGSPGAVDPLERLGVAAPADRVAASQVVRLERRGEPPLCLRAGGAPVRASAERVCPTGDAHPVEVVVIDGVEALLLRPEHLGQRVPPP